MKHSSYFDLLPCGVLEAIVRQLSQRPRHRHWRTYIQAIDAQLLLSTTSPLHTAATRQLTALTATNDNFTRGYNDTLILRSVEDGVALKHIVRDAGQYLIEVHLRSTFLGSSLLNLLARRCVSLRVLEIHYIMPVEAFTELLAARGPTLHSFSAWFLGTPTHLDAIAAHCSTLKKLELQYLRRPCEQVWKAVGDTLQELTISFSITSLPPQTLAHIRRHCRNLTSLYVRNNYNGFDTRSAHAVAALYVSLGPKLQNACTQDLPSRACASIIAACPTMNASAGHPTFVAAQMLALGGAIRELRLDLTDDESMDKLIAASSRCYNVEQVSARASPFMCSGRTDTFRAFFSLPKPRLFALRWAEPIDTSFVQDALIMLSKATKSLQELSLSFGTLDTSGIEAVVAANSALEKVEIHFCRTSLGIGKDAVVNTERAFIKLLFTFMTAPRLAHLCISIDGDTIVGSAMRKRRKAIESACVRYRRRSTFVLIAGVDYLE